MSSIILYLKSEKFDLVEYTMPHWGHWCSAGYRSKGTEFFYTGDDAEAKTLIENSELGNSCKIVDLSNCNFLFRLQAKLIGVNKTPTLVVDDKKYKGLENIKKFLNQ